MDAIRADLAASFDSMRASFEEFMAVTVSPILAAAFDIGQIVRARRGDLRGVIVDVDPCYAFGDEGWKGFKGTPWRRDAPFYTTLCDMPDGSPGEFYIAEDAIEADFSGEPIRHPKVPYVFGTFRGHRYDHDLTLSA